MITSIQVFAIENDNFKDTSSAIFETSKRPTGSHVSGVSTNFKITPAGPIAVCNNQSPVQLKVDTIGAFTGNNISYKWVLVTNLSNSLGNNATFNVSSTGNYTCIVSYTQNNNQLIDTCNQVSVTIYTPNVNVSATNNSICNGTSTTLTATGASVYVWSPATGLSSTSGSPITASPTASTTYKVVGTDANGCKDSANITISVKPLPIASFTYSPNSGCAKPKRELDFNSTSNSNGSGTPLNYSWNFGDPNSSNNTSNNNSPSHKFKGNGLGVGGVFVVTLTVTGQNGCSATTQQTLNLGAAPDATLWHSNNFAVCSGSLDLLVSDSSQTSSINSSYQIDWGDGSPFEIYTNALFGDHQHTYPTQGYYNITYTVFSASGCKDVTTYKAFFGSNPLIPYTFPGNSLDVCIPLALTLSRDTTKKNSPGTIITFSSNDPTLVDTFIAPLTSDYTHIFNKTSCGVVNPYSNNNSYYIKITATNPCGNVNFPSQVIMGPITTIDKPKPNFIISPDSIECVGNSIKFINTTVKGIIGSMCDSVSTFRWSVSPGVLNTNYQIVSGSFTNGTVPLELKFLIPGNYVVKLIARLNNISSLCNSDSISKPICINPLPTVAFTADKDSGCAPLNVNALGTTNTPTCLQNTFSWSVSYVPTAGCLPNTINYVYTNGTDSTSQNPKFQFISPGIYTISCYTIAPHGRCVSPVITKTIIVKSKPVVGLSNIPSTLCINQSINPSLSATCYIDASTTYLWNITNGTPSSSNTVSPGTISFNTSGNQTISVAVTNVCGVTNQNQTIYISTLPSPNAGSDQITCSNVPVNIGSVSTTGYSYSWSPAAGLSSSTVSNPTVTLSNSGSINITQQYVLTVTNSYGCTKTDTVVVTVKPLPTVGLIATSNSICNGGNTTLTASGANTYLWSTGASTASITVSPNANTTYTVTGTNTTTACSNVASVTITVNPNPVITVNSPTICDGQSATLNASGANTYIWSPAAGLSATTGASVTANPIVNSQYSVSGTITSTGCNSTAISNVTVNPNPAAPVATSPIDYCKNATPNILTATASSGNSLCWYPSASGGACNPNAPTPSTGTVTVLNYYVGQTNNNTGCNSPITTIVVNVNPLPAAPVVSSPVTYCQNNVAVPLTAIATTGNTLYWYTTPSGGAFSTTAPTPTTTSTGSTTYYVSQVNNTTGCDGPRAPITVTVKATPSISLTFTNPSACGSTNGNGSITLSGLTNGLVYTLSYVDPSGNNISNSITAVGTTYVISNLIAGTYSAITVTLNSCPSNVLAATLTAPNRPSNPVAAPGSVICAGASMTLSVVNPIAGATYSWFGPNTQSVSAGTGSSITINPTNNNSGGYYYVIVSVNNCPSLPDSVLATVNPLPSAPIVNTPITYCQGATATSLNATATSGNTLNWYNVATGGTALAGPPLPVTTTVGSTTYYVSQTTNPANCQGSRSPILVTINPKPIIPDTIRTICSGAGFTVTPVNYSPNIIVPINTTYTWVISNNNANLTGQSNQSIPQSQISQTLTNTSNSIQAITYTVTPTSGAAGNCVGATFNVLVNVNPLPRITDTTLSTCSGVAFNLTPVNNLPTQIVPTNTTYTWTISSNNTNITGQSIQNAGQSSIGQTLNNNTNLPQSLVYRVTPTSGGCIGNPFLVTVTVNPKPVVPAQAINICSGAAFTLTLSNAPLATILPANTTFTWVVNSNTNLTGQSAQITDTSIISQTLTNISNIQQPLVYTITPKSGANGNCIGSAFNLTVNVDPMPKMRDTTLSLCSGSNLSYSPLNNPTSSIVPNNTTYTWTWNLVNPGTVTGMSASSPSTGATLFSQSLSNTTNVQQTVIYTVTPVYKNCIGQPFTITLLVNPAPVIFNQSLTICSGQLASFSALNGQPSASTIVPTGTTYTWIISTSNSNIVGASNQSNGVGTFNQTLTNSTNTTQQIVYTLSPVSGAVGTCSGPTFTMTINVNPKPSIRDTIVTICSGAPLNFTPSSSGNIIPLGTTYSWTAPAVNGLTGGNAGTGSSLNILLSNPSDTLQTAVYTITPITSSTLGNCSGNTFTLTVKVNPAPHVNFSPSTQSICSGGITQLVTLSSPTPGASLPWTATAPAGISGVLTSGTNTIGAQTLINSTNQQIVVTYFANPVTTGTTSCPGAQTPYFISVNPKPFIHDTTLIICNDSTFNLNPSNNQPYNIVPANTTYTWTVGLNNNVTGQQNNALPGISNISQTLTNLTNTAQTIVYTVTPLSGDSGICPGNSFRLSVTVNPSPRILDTLLKVCSGNQLNYSPANNQPTVIVPSNTQYTWSFAPNSNISGATNEINGANIFSQTLTNISSVSQRIVYTVMPNSGNCLGLPFYIIVRVDPSPLIPNQKDTICSEGTFSINLINNPPGTIIPAGTNYTWTVGANSNVFGQSNQSAPQLSISQKLTNLSSVIQHVIYTITPISGDTGLCSGNNFTLDVTVHPKPHILDTTLEVCNGSSLTVTPSSLFAGNVIPVGTTYTWGLPITSPGLNGAGSGNGSGLTVQLFNLSDTIQTAIYSLVPVSGPNFGNCIGDTFKVTIRVTPSPHVSFSPASQSICSGNATNIVNIISPTPGVNSPWSATIIPSLISGVALSGTNTIPVQTLFNSGNTQLVVTYSVSPVTTGGAACPGTPTPYLIAVNPVPFIHDTTLTICDGGSISFSPSNNQPYNIVPLNTTYTWTVSSNTNVTGQTNQLNGSNLVAQSIQNLTNTVQTLVYTITPLSGDSGRCQGNPFTLTLIIEPTPKIQDTTITVCSGSPFNYLPSNVPPNQLVPSNTSFVWTVQQNPFINGASNNSNGVNAISQTLSNLSNTAQSLIYTITPTSGNCVGLPFQLTVTVYPAPVIPNQTLSICSENSFTLLPVNNAPITIVPSNTTYTWTVGINNNVIGQSNQPVSQPQINQFLTNLSPVDQVVNYSIVPTSGAVGNCPGLPFNLAVTVNPKPTIADTTISICSGQLFTVLPSMSIANNIIPANTTYAWSISSMSAFLSGGVAGNSSSISGTLYNSSDSVQIAVYTIIPTSGSNGNCVGRPFQLTVNVNPAPRAVFMPGPQTICSGNSFNTVTISSPTPNVTIPWSVINPPNSVIGYDISGNTTIPSRLLNNLTNIPVVINYTATASTVIGAACPGAPALYTITVNPVPIIHDTSFVICSGGSFAFIPANNQPYNIVPSNSTYTWTVSINNNTTGQSDQNTPVSVIGQTIKNLSNVPQLIDYLVTPVSGDAGTCIGLPFYVHLTVNPTPEIPSLFDTICSGNNFSQLPTNGLPNASTIVPINTTYSWSAPIMPPGGGGAASANNATSIFGNLTNSTFAPFTVIYQVTPVSGANGNCIGQPFDVNVTVNPLASISNNPLSQTVCNTGFTNAINWSSYTAGSSYSWHLVSSGSITGFVNDGNGNTFPAMQLFNSGIAKDSVVYEISSTANACSGPPTPYKFYVNPDAKALFSFPVDRACWPFSIILQNNGPSTANGNYNWYANNIFLGTQQNFPGYTINNSDDSIDIKMVAVSLYGCKNDSITQRFYTKNKPRPSFTFAPRVGCSPLVVSFNNTTPLIDSFRYEWNFGNQVTSNLKSPNPVTFVESRFFVDTTYYITLKAFNECDTVYFRDSVTVLTKPQARFGVSSSSGCSPFKIQITNYSVGFPNRFYWNFGNGVKDTTFSNGSFFYTYYVGNQVDTFPLMLIAENQCARDTQIIYIRVAPNVIRPNISVNATDLYGCAPHQANFINSSSGATSFTWDFGDGSNVIVTNQFQLIVPHVYTSPGTYTVRIDLTNGCSDSVDFKQITVYAKPKASFIVNPVFCLGDTVGVLNNSTNGNNFRWEWGDGFFASGFQPNHLYNTAGNYNINLRVEKISPFGLVCFDTTSRSVRILVKPDSTLQTNLGSPNCAPFTLNANTPGITNESVTWYVFDTSLSSAPIIFNTQSIQYVFRNPGTYLVKMVAVNAAGCKDSSFRIVKVYGIPNANYGPKNITTCSLDTTIFHLNTSTFNDNGPLTYRWLVDGVQKSINGNFSYRYFATPTDLLPKIFNTQLIATNIVGCSDTASGFVQLNPSPKSAFTVVNPNACIPFIPIVNNVSTYATTFNWYLNGALVDTSRTPSFIITSSLANYTIKLVTSNIYACRKDSSVFSFISRIMPKAGFTLNDTLGCNGQLSVITRNTSINANSYLWYWGDASANSTLPNPTHLYSALGQFQIALIANDGVCKDTAYKFVTVANKPVVDFSADNLKNCDTGRVQFINLTRNADTYKWYFSDGTSSTIYEPIKIFPPSITPYSIKLVAFNNFGCKDSLTKANFINAYIPPSADFYINPSATISIPNYSFIFTNLTLNSSFYKYNWTLGDGSTDQSTRDVEHKYADTGVYPVRLIVLDTATNCPDTILKIARIIGYPGYLYVPNAFYPNSLQTQFRYFKPLGKGLAEYKFQVFDSWGKVLFESSRLDVSGIPVEGWDGTYKGRPMPQDGYAWRITAKFRNGQNWSGMSYSNNEKGAPGNTFGTVTLFR